MPLRSPRQDVAREVCLTPLPGRPLKVSADCLHQSLVVVGGHEVNAFQAALLELGEELSPARFRLAVGELEAQYLATTVIGDSNRYQHARVARPTVLPPDLEIYGVDYQKGMAPVQRPVAKGIHHRIQPAAEIRHHRLGEAPPAKLLGHKLYLARRHAVDHHLHHGQKQSLLAPLITLEHGGAEFAAVSMSGNTQGYGPDPRCHVPFPEAVPVSRAPVAALVAGRPDLLGRLGLQYLVENRLQQFCEGIILSVL